MPIVWDKNGNEVVVADVEAALKETWLIHRRVQPRYFRTNPDRRVPEQKLADGVERVYKRAKMRGEKIQARAHAELDKLIEREAVTDQARIDAARRSIDKQAGEFVENEVARVISQYLASGDEKLASLARSMERNR